MSLPRYPKYKNSGISWVGPIPSHWEVRRTKFLFDLLRRPVRPDDEIVTAFRDGEVTLRINRRLDGFTNAVQEIGYQGVRAGDLVIHAMDAFAGAIGVSDSDGKSTPVYSVCRSRAGVAESLYYGKLLRHMALCGFINALAKGIRERSTEFRWVDAGEVSLPLPPLDEQKKIVRFIEGEAGKIDVLVEEQRRLIELLKEKRQAVISHAVTKGLNPDALMKDSGIEWLGEVPSHWRVEKVSRLFQANKGKNGQLLTKEFCAEHEGEYPVYSGQTENDGVMASIDEFEFDFGEEGVLFSTTVGAKAMHLMHVRGKFSLSQNCMIICRRSNDVSVRFFYYGLQPLFLFERSLIPDHMQPSFRMDDLYGFRVLIPPRGEQIEIATFLDQETARIDALGAEAARAIDLLQERRTALISAAVTGKIDVRGLATGEAA